MKKLTPQTKSFIILFAIALIGTYGCLVLTNKMRGYIRKDYLNPQGNYTVTTYNPAQEMTIRDALAAETLETVDTSDWKTYTDDTFPISFKYKPDWKIKPAVKAAEFTIIEIDPGRKFYNIRIYISDKGYYGVDSVPTRQETINGQTALNATNMLYGFQNGLLYYTFDVGVSVKSLKTDFNALVHSVTFGQSE